jgi:hypothetical protein
MHFERGTWIVVALHDLSISSLDSCCSVRRIYAALFRRDERRVDDVLPMGIYFDHYVVKNSVLSFAAHRPPPFDVLARQLGEALPVIPSTVRRERNIQQITHSISLRFSRTAKLDHWTTAIYPPLMTPSCTK